MCSAMCAMPCRAPSKRAPARTATAIAVSGPGAGSKRTVSAPCDSRDGSRSSPRRRPSPPPAVAPRRRALAPSPAVEHRHEPLDLPRPLRRVREPGRLRRAAARLDEDRLPHAELPQPLGAAVSRPDAALLDTSEGQARHPCGYEALVDAGVAALDAPREGDAALDVARPHARVEAVARVVGEPERLLDVTHRHHRDHRTEGLLL